MESLVDLPETPRKNYSPDGTCILCVQHISESKRRIKLFKNGSPTEVSVLISDILQEDVLCGSIVCRNCFDRAKTVHTKLSGIKAGYQTFKKSTQRVKRCNDSPGQSVKRTPLKCITNLEKTKVNRPLFTSPANIGSTSSEISLVKPVIKVHASTQTHDQISDITSVEVVSAYM
jgi:hypothetical protein